MGLPQKYKFQIDGVFLWSTGSWDVLAVYPESTTAEGSYFDPVVAEIIAAHNAGAQAAGHAFMAPSRAARWVLLFGVISKQPVRRHCLVSGACLGRTRQRTQRGTRS